MSNARKSAHVHNPCHADVGVYRRKQHYGRKHKVSLLRTLYGTPLDEIDIFGHWAGDVKEQHYAQMPAKDPVANTLGALSAALYYLERGDLDPSKFKEFEAMVNSVLPWIGRKLARAEEVSGHSLRRGWRIDGQASREG
jgi:hypothetical protein